MKKRLTAILTVLLVLTMLAGCTSGAQSTASSAAPAASTSQAAASTAQSVAEPAAAQPYELSVAWWGGEARHKKTLDMIDLYMKEFPEATIVSQYASYDEYWTKMATQAAGGNLPDVYLVQLTYLGEYASKGLMRPLQDLVDAGKLDVSNYTPGALSSSSYNGQLVGVSFGDTASCAVYNKTLIESVGYPLPKDQMLYSELAEYLKGLAAALPAGTYAAELGSRHEHILEAFTRQQGGYGVTSEDGKSLGYTKEMLTKYFSYYYDLFKAGVYGTMDFVLDDREKQFGDSSKGKGTTAFWFTNVNQAKIFQATVEGELGVVRGPLIDGYTHQFVEAAVCSTWAISGKTAKVDESAQFISHMVNDWELQKIYNMDIGVPGSTAIQQNLIDGLNLSDKVDAMKKREIEVMQNILNTIEPFNGRPSGYGAVVQDMYKKTDEILYGTMTVEQAVEAHFAAAPALLS